MANKKTVSEKRATKRAAQARFRDNKRAAGLVPIEVWIPAATAEKLKGKKRIGIVVEDKKDVGPVSFIIPEMGKGTPV